MNQTIAQAIRDGADRLRAVSDSPRLEARLLLAHALGFTQAELLRQRDAAADTSAFEASLVRRLAREPIDLILGHREFWTLDFLVSRDTLIPRPDSETVIRAALATVRRPPRHILDLGTGTGCLLLSLLHEYPGALGIGIDLNLDAARLAQANAARNGLDGRAAFVQANWSDPIQGRFDLIVSNPPYIPAGDIAGLMPEVALHEPRSALDGGPDGFDAYRAIIGRLAGLLAPDGLAVLELGAGQAASVDKMAVSAGFVGTVHLDLAGIARVIVLRSPLG